MKERPILFSTPMVQAILEGRKTMTRRLNNLNTVNDKPDNYNFLGLEVNAKSELFSTWQIKEFEDIIFPNKFPYGNIGDKLWVREAFEVHINNNGGDDYTTLRRIADDSWFDYPTSMRAGKHPSLHFPKQAARIWLEITGVKVERLQDISEEEAIAEGIERHIIHSMFYKDYGWKRKADETKYTSALNSFKSLWYLINGEESWNANPWVWVIEFKNIKYGTKF